MHFGNQPSVPLGRMTGRKTTMDKTINESPKPASGEATAAAVDGRWHRRVWFEVSRLRRSRTAVGQTIIIDRRGAAIVGATICDMIDNGRDRL